MKIEFFLRRILLIASLLSSLPAYAGQHNVTFSGYVSDVNNSNFLIERGDLISGALTIDTGAPNWYGNDRNWGAYEATVAITYGKVVLNSMIALYVDVQGSELFGVARVPIDGGAMTYSEFRFWVSLNNVGSTSLTDAVNTMATNGVAALVTFDHETEIQSYASQMSVTLVPVPEPSTSVLMSVGVFSLLVLSKVKALRT